MELGLHEGAASDLNEALRLDPYDFGAAAHLAESLEALRDWEGAARALEMAGSIQGPRVVEIEQQAKLQGLRNRARAARLG